MYLNHFLNQPHGLVKFVVYFTNRIKPNQTAT